MKLSTWKAWFFFWSIFDDWSTQAKLAEERRRDEVRAVGRRADVQCKLRQRSIASVDRSFEFSLDTEELVLCCPSVHQSNVFVLHKQDRWDSKEGLYILQSILLSDLLKV